MVFVSGWFGGEMMSVITISREFGSEGDTIAEKVAQALGYHLVDKAMIGSLLSQYGLVEFERDYDVLPGFRDRFSGQKAQRRDQMVSMLNQIVRAVAQRGNVVIVGRSGFAIIQGFADVLNVRIQTPLPVRVNRVMAQQQISAEQAETIVKENDKARLAFIESFYKAKWDAASAFDLVIDTSKVSPDLAATWLIDAAKALSERTADDRPTCSSIQVDPILAGAVSDALK
jgi:cytidylate kinase